MTIITPEWITDLTQLPAVVAAADTWYLDTEFIRERTFHAELALVQVAAADHILLLDIPTLPDPGALGQLLKEKTLVMHACSEDVEVLTHTAGTSPRLMEDTQLAAALVGFPLQLGYQRLVEEVCGIALAKEATRSDWLKRPLAPNQLAYAADDVRYLETVRHWLGDKLALLGRMTWWKEECQRLLTQVLKQTPPDDIWRQVKGAGNLAEQPLTRLKLLAAWRDQQARQRNLPRSFIIKDAELMALCQKSPASTTQLANLGLHPSLLRREGNILLDLLQQAKTLPPPEPLPGPLDSEQKQRCNKWRKMAQQIAADLGLEPEVLVRRRWLEALVRNPDEVPEPLTGWRYEVITRLLLTSAG